MADYTDPFLDPTAPIDCATDEIPLAGVVPLPVRTGPSGPFKRFDVPVVPVNVWVTPDEAEAIRSLCRPGEDLAEWFRRMGFLSPRPGE